MSELAEPKRARGRPKKTEGERDDGNRRQALISAAAQLFKRQGYDATSTREIAALVGMQSGSPFYHFDSKAALLFAVMEQGMRAALQRQADALAGVPVPLQLRKLVRAHFDILLGPGSDFVPVMLYEWRSLTATQRSAIAKLQRDYEACWAGALRPLCEAGHIQADARLARLMFLGALNWSVQWYKAKKGASVDELTEQAMQLFVPTFDEGDRR